MDKTPKNNETTYQLVTPQGSVGDRAIFPDKPNAEAP